MRLNNVLLCCLAPRSQPAANIPTTDNEDIKYDIKYFSRNTRSMGHIDEEVRCQI
jgi:hypothetical protein